MKNGSFVEELNTVGDTKKTSLSNFSEVMQINKNIAQKLSKANEILPGRPPKREPAQCALKIELIKLSEFKGNIPIAKQRLGPQSLPSQTLPGNIGATGAILSGGSQQNSPQNIDTFKNRNNLVSFEIGAQQFSLHQNNDVSAVNNSNISHKYQRSHNDGGWYQEEQLQDSFKDRKQIVFQRMNFSCSNQNFTFSSIQERKGDPIFNVVLCDVKKLIEKNLYEQQESEPVIGEYLDESTIVNTSESKQNIQTNSNLFQQAYANLAVASNETNEDPNAAALKQGRQALRQYQIEKQQLEETGGFTYVPESTNDRTVVFESKFQCGNLSLAYKVTQTEYNLLIQNDINTKGYTQWFFFKTSNTRKGNTVKFNILNCSQTQSLFQMGMKVMIYSRSKSKNENLGWFRGGFDITYQQNSFVRLDIGQGVQKYYYTLSFQYQFEDDFDQVFFAYNYPYTYTELSQYIDQLASESNPASQFLKRKSLCKTIAGNSVDLLTITDPNVMNKSKQGIVISARVHPGETVSSFIMKGNTQQADILRKTFIFKLAPMLNPDGVIHGNYRSSLAGCDLNRRWQQPDQYLHPQIYHFQKYIKNFQSQTHIALFCDLHGHSIKKNIFIYGCHDEKKPLACRELPFLLSKLYEPFNYKDCNFKVQKDKESTARIVLWRDLCIPNIFTLESSFCGPSYDDVHFTTQDLESMGHRMCMAILIYFQADIKVKQLNSNESGKKSTIKLNTTFSEDDVFNQIKKENDFSAFRQQVMQQLNNNQDLQKVGMENEQDQSDSSPSDDNLQEDDEELGGHSLRTPQIKKIQTIIPSKRTPQPHSVSPPFQSINNNNNSLKKFPMYNGKNYPPPPPIPSVSLKIKTQQNSKALTNLLADQQLASEKPKITHISPRSSQVDNSNWRMGIKGSSLSKRSGNDGSESPDEIQESPQQSEINQNQLVYIDYYNTPFLNTQSIQQSTQISNSFLNNYNFSKDPAYDQLNNSRELFDESLLLDKRRNLNNFRTIQKLNHYNYLNSLGMQLNLNFIEAFDTIAQPDQYQQTQNQTQGLGNSQPQYSNPFISEIDFLVQQQQQQQQQQFSQQPLNINQSIHLDSFSKFSNSKTKHTIDSTSKQQIDQREVSQYLYDHEILPQIKQNTNNSYNLQGENTINSRKNFLSTEKDHNSTFKLEQNQQKQNKKDEEDQNGKNFCDLQNFFQQNFLNKHNNSNLANNNSYNTANSYLQYKKLNHHKERQTSQQPNKSTLQPQDMNFPTKDDIRSYQRNQSNQKINEILVYSNVPIITKNQLNEIAQRNQLMSSVAYQIENLKVPNTLSHQQPGLQKETPFAIINGKPVVSGLFDSFGDGSPGDFQANKSNNARSNFSVYQNSSFNSNNQIYSKKNLISPSLSPYQDNVINANQNNIQEDEMRTIKINMKKHKKKIIEQFTKKRKHKTLEMSGE